MCPASEAIELRGSIAANVAEPDDRRLVKSADRVRDLGEVFTPADTVEAMLDLLPDVVWGHHPSVTFLEPACGDGNFLVAILARKLTEISESYAAGSLTAGNSQNSPVFHALEALSSIYAVDISVDNVIGGTPGHEVGARGRLVIQMRQWHTDMFGDDPGVAGSFVSSVQWIVDRNVLVANMLERNPDGSVSGRDELPILEYTWQPESLQVTVARTTLGDVAAQAELETSDTTLSLFGPKKPERLWSGSAADIHSVDGPAPVSGKMPSRNGVER